MNIDRDEARRVADLAHLEFDDARLERLAAEMTQILEYVESLPSSMHDSETTRDTRVAPLRNDVVRPSIDRDVIAENAPAFADGFFVVPKVIS